MVPRDNYFDHLFRSVVLRERDKRADIRRTDRQTDRRTNRQTDRQTDRRTDRQTDMLYTMAAMAAMATVVRQRPPVIKRIRGVDADALNELCHQTNKHQSSYLPNAELTPWPRDAHMECAASPRRTISLCTKREQYVDWRCWGLGRGAGRYGRGGGAYSFIACLSHLTIYHASLSRRSRAT